MHTGKQTSTQADRQADKHTGRWRTNRCCLGGFFGASSVVFDDDVRGIGKGLNSIPYAVAGRLKRLADHACDKGRTDSDNCAGAGPDRVHAAAIGQHAREIWPDAE